MVYNLALNYLGNSDDAKDCVQEVFIKIHQKLNKFKGESSIKTWVYRIAVNTCLDKIKSNKRKASLFQVASYLGFKLDKPVFDHPGIQLEQKEAVANIMAMISELPKNQQTALILKRIEGLSTKEISEILECSEKSVESLLSRAKSTLKTKLSEGK
jgi:RNA polymerase sigma-70 factor (ECF subfamily)